MVENLQGEKALTQLINKEVPTQQYGPVGADSRELHDA